VIESPLEITSISGTQGCTMNKTMSLLAVCAALSMTLPSVALAAAHTGDAAAKTPQQNKMGMCNKDAEGKKGDERKAFMKDCLSAQKSTQQSKMKTCNVEAKGKKGGDRKAFMKQCLSA
jgi:psiF repeat